MTQQEYEYSDKQIARARELSMMRAGAKTIDIFDGDNFRTVWTGTLGGNCVGMGDGRHSSRKDAIEDAKAFKQHCIRVSTKAQEGV